MQNSLPMPSNARCAVGCCDNDRRYPDLWVKRSHDETLHFHKWPKDERDAEIWRKQVLKGRKDDFNPNPGASGTFVCSNHFPKGKRTRGNPDTDYPSMFLTLSDYQSKPSPTKRKTGTKKALDTDSESEEPESGDEEMKQLSQEGSGSTEEDEHLAVIPFQFEQLTRECDVKFYTGIPSTAAFRCLFDHLSPKARNMQYWRGPRQTERESRPVSPFDEYLTTVGVESNVVRHENWD